MCLHNEVDFFIVLVIHELSMYSYFTKFHRKVQDITERSFMLVKRDFLITKTIHVVIRAKTNTYM